MKKLMLFLLMTLFCGGLVTAFTPFDDWDGLDYINIHSSPNINGTYLWASFLCDNATGDCFRPNSLNNSNGGSGSGINNTGVAPYLYNVGNDIYFNGTYNNESVNASIIQKVEDYITAAFVKALGFYDVTELYNRTETNATINTLISLNNDTLDTTFITHTELGNTSILRTPNNDSFLASFDTNETTRVDQLFSFQNNLTSVDCDSGDFVIGTYGNGSVLCATPSVSVEEDGVLIKYQNITNLPTCAGTDKLTFNGAVLSCAADQTGGVGGFEDINITGNNGVNISIGDADILSILGQGNYLSTSAGGKTINITFDEELINSTISSIVGEETGVFVTFTDLDNASILRVTNLSSILEQANLSAEAKDVILNQSLEGHFATVVDVDNASIIRNTNTSWVQNIITSFVDFSFVNALGFFSTEGNLTTLLDNNYANITGVINTTTQFGGDASGTYDNLTITATAADYSILVDVDNLTVGSTEVTLDYTFDAADLEYTIGASSARGEFQSRFDLSSISGTISSAIQCFYMVSPDAGFDNDINVSLVKNYTWTEADYDATEWWAEPLFNDTTTTLSSITINTYSCVNVTNLAVQNQLDGQDQLTIRWRDPDITHAEFGGVNDGTTLNLGLYASDELGATFNAREAASNRPYMTIVYEGSVNQSIADKVTSVYPYLDTDYRNDILNGSDVTFQNVSFPLYQTCTALETDGSGNLVCGSDDVGGTNFIANNTDASLNNVTIQNITTAGGGVITSNGSCPFLVITPDTHLCI